ncbi:MAG: nucleotidyltransferase substrate binding protein [Sedimentisphaerales bacterium]|nr:nucleotidyltransferase substrate binding protein [Sedimentisphaerales bacterium]MBN2842258.1 nucleotidyltransferase substrate binding protein [Sedimentisphaerales bacterium]
MDDIRWKQRFDNFIRAYREFSEAVALAGQKELTKLEKQGLIQSFEYTHELAWNVLKDFLTEQGISGLIGSRDTTREAFRQELVNDGAVWMDMIKSRNLTSHTYDQKLADEVIDKIVAEYYAEFRLFYQDFTCRESAE